MGRDIVFGAQKYKPEDAGAQRLIAHELVHVIQQTSGNAGRDAPRIQRFTTDEHKAIGKEAYQLAASGFAKPSFQRSDLYRTLRDGSRFEIGDKIRTYGDIVADADFFASMEDMIREHGDRPGQLGSAVLASRNVSHFTPDNILRWVPEHDSAVNQMLDAYGQLRYVRDFLNGIEPLLQAGRAALLRGDFERAERVLKAYSSRFEPQQKRMEKIAQGAHATAREALMRNAFADHFLTDAFSAGHVVTPRAEILQEAGVRLDQMPSRASLVRGAYFPGPTWSELGELRAQARSLAWHNLDNFYGVEVNNNDRSFGSWIACGDGCSERTKDPHWSNTKKAVVRAATASIKDLWTAGLTGARPANYRPVLDLVPRPTFKNYPAWSDAEWQNQLGYIRGENASPAKGAQMLPFAVSLYPIEHCTQPDIGCYNPFVRTQRDWIVQYNFNRWVRPWISRIQATAAARYRF